MGSTEIIIIAIIIFFIAFLTNGWPIKRKSNLSVILAIFGLLLLPLAHIVASYFVVDIANEAIKQCTMDQGNLVGSSLSENLGVFSFIGESIETQLNEGYSEEIQQHLAKAIGYRKWPQILMYASLITIFLDLLCLYFKGSNSKTFLLVIRSGFTLAICYLVYSGTIIVYEVSSTRLAAKTYGLFELIGGTSYSYSGSVALFAVAYFLIPLIVIHLIHFKCANRYFDSEEEDYDSPIVKPEPASQPVPIASSDVQNNQISYQTSQELLPEQAQSSNVEAVVEEASIEQLDELLHAGILTKDEYDLEISKITPSTQDGDTKIGMLRKLKSLLEGNILSPEEYKQEKIEILYSEKIPAWIPDKTMVEILIEFKKLLDDGTLVQEEFDTLKKEMLNS